VSFFNITTFGKTAEFVAKYMKRGARISLTGSLKQNTWDDKESGKKRSTIDIIANTIQGLDAKGSNETLSPGAVAQQIGGEVESADIPF